MIEKKVSSGTFVIVLGIICIISLSGFAGSIAYYFFIINDKDSIIQSKDTIIQSKDDTIQKQRTETNQLKEDLDDNIADYSSQINNLDIQISSLNTEKIQLQTLLDESMSLHNQTQVWLNEKTTLLDQMEIWLTGNKTLLDQTQSWLDENIAVLNQIQLQLSNFRKSHTITQTPNAGTDYQVMVNVHYDFGIDYDVDVYLLGKCRTDFGDIRFTEDDGKTELSYWMEEYSSGENATFWVKINDDLSLEDVTFYIYYGNINATTTSNGGNTFPFFDDFSSSPNGWTLDSGVFITDGELVLPYNTGCWEHAYKTRPSDLDNYRYKQRTKCATLNNGWRSYPRGMLPFRDTVPMLVWRDYYEGYEYVNKVRIETEGGVYSPAIANVTRDSNYHIQELTKYESTYTLYWDDLIPVTAIDSTPETGTYVAFGTEEYLKNANVYVDWVFLGKYINPEPVHGDWRQEEINWK